MSLLLVQRHTRRARGHSPLMRLHAHAINRHVIGNQLFLTIYISSLYRMFAIDF